MSCCLPTSLHYEKLTKDGAWPGLGLPGGETLEYQDRFCVRAETVRGRPGHTTTFVSIRCHQPALQTNT